MATPHIIGLTGYAGTGKDTVREMLARDHGYHGMAFADPIREMIARLFTGAEISTDFIHERELKEATIPALGVSYRHLAQTLGTEWGRAVHSELWVRLAVARMQAISAETFHTLAFVFSDVRFPNEAEMIRSRGGQVWRVERPGTAPVRAHPSESNVAEIEADRVICNTGSVEQLWCQVDALMEATQDQPDPAGEAMDSTEGGW